MDSFQFNKIAGATLVALLILFACRELGAFVFHKEPLETAGYLIEIPEETTQVAEASVAVEEPLPDFGIVLASADPTDGESVARKCTSCHSFNKGGRHQTGPNLWDIVGRDIGVADGYPYSNAMGAYGEPWTYEALYRFLENPRSYLEGTKMAFAGLNRRNDRIAILAYLRSLSDAPAPLPDPQPETASQG